MLHFSTPFLLTQKTGTQKGDILSSKKATRANNNKNDVARRVPKRRRELSASSDARPAFDDAQKKSSR